MRSFFSHLPALWMFWSCRSPQGGVGERGWCHWRGGDELLGKLEACRILTTLIPQSPANGRLHPSPDPHTALWNRGWVFPSLGCLTVFNKPNHETCNRVELVTSRSGHTFTAPSIRGKGHCYRPYLTAVVTLKRSSDDQLWHH